MIHCKGQLFGALLFALPVISRLGWGGSYGYSTIEMFSSLALACGFVWWAAKVQVEEEIRMVEIQKEMALHSEKKASQDAQNSPQGDPLTTPEASPNDATNSP